MYNCERRRHLGFIVYCIFLRSPFLTFVAEIVLQLHRKIGLISSWQLLSAITPNNKTVLKNLYLFLPLWLQFILFLWFFYVKECYLRFILSFWYTCCIIREYLNTRLIKIKLWSVEWFKFELNCWYLLVELFIDKKAKYFHEENPELISPNSILRIQYPVHKMRAWNFHLRTSIFKVL